MTPSRGKLQALRKKTLQLLTTMLERRMWTQKSTFLFLLQERKLGPWMERVLILGSSLQQGCSSFRLTELRFNLHLENCSGRRSYDMISFTEQLPGKVERKEGGWSWNQFLTVLTFSSVSSQSNIYKDKTSLWCTTWKEPHFHLFFVNFRVVFQK